MEYALILLWIGSYLGLGVAGLPVAARLFPRFPDRGAAMALPCTLSILTLVAYWIGHIRFGPGALIAGAGVVVTTALLALRRGVEIRARRYAEAAVVFVLGFLLVVSIRAVSPGIVPAGGEKFLNFALLNAVLRADTLPPEDPWYASRPVRYYYGAHLRAGLLTQITGTPPRYSYNLALAGVYATLITAAYGLAGAVTDARGRSARLGGGLGAVLVGLGGNLATPVRLLFGLLPQSLALEYGHAVFSGIRAPHAVAVREASSLSPFSYWFARYVIEGTLNPFPLWAFLNGDLNAYMSSTPLLLLVAGLCYAYYRTPEVEYRRRRLLVFGAIPLVGGLLGLTSTWSLPTVIGLLWLVSSFADADPATLLPRRCATAVPGHDVERGTLHPLAELRRIGVSVLVALVGGAGAGLVAAPFLLFHTPKNRGIGFLLPRSDLVPLLLVHGVFIGAFLLYFWPHVRRVRGRTALASAIAFGPLAVVFLHYDLAAIVLFVPLLVGGWLLLRLGRDVGYEVVLLVGAVGLVLAVEFAYARVWPFGAADPRWTTVYKVYMQVWVLSGVAAAVAFAVVLGRSRDALTATANRIRSRRTVRHVLAVCTVALLLAGSTTFSAAALTPHFDHVVTDSQSESLTLDGMAYVEEYHPVEAAAIEWLDDRSGTPTIAAKPGYVHYTWKNAPSSLTGVPTVLGWRHEIRYRGEAAYAERRRDLRLLYTSNDSVTVRALLRKYDVRYIYVGPNEKVAYAGKQNFTGIRGVSVAFKNSNVTIYRVNRSVTVATPPNDSG